MKLKYGGYYPEVVEKLAQKRDKLRKQGRFSEADVLREEICDKYNVDVLDGKDGYMLQWSVGNRE